MSRVVVISPPIAVVTADEAREVRVFSADDATAYIDTLLAVAQGQIDGRDGWLHRAIGLQTLEIVVPAKWIVDVDQLPLPPYVDTVTDIIAEDGRSRAFRYRAGYGVAPASPVPPAIKHAIILMAGVLRDATPNEGGLVKRKTVDGVGSREYTLPDGAADSMRQAAESLLKPYWLPAYD